MTILCCEVWECRACGAAMLALLGTDTISEPCSNCGSHDWLSPSEQNDNPSTNGDA